MALASFFEEVTKKGFSILVKTVDNDGAASPK